MAGRGCCAAMLVVVWGAALAAERTLWAAEMTTANHPLSSSLAVDVYLGDPDTDGALLGTVGPLAVVGSGDVSWLVGGGGELLFQISSSQFGMGSAMGVMDLAPLGTVEFVLNDIGFSFTTEPKPIVGGDSFEFPFDATSQLTFNQGSVAVQNPTGILLDLLGPGVIYGQDFSSNPFTANPNFAAGLPLHGTLDFGPTLFSPAAELNMHIPSVSTQFQTLGDGFPPLYLNFRGEVHVAAPEPSSLALLGVGAAALAWTALRRRHRKG